MTLYLDTSSLMKLFVEEAGSSDVRQLTAGATVVATSVVAYAETRAALSRLRRTGHLTATQFSAAKRKFETEWPAVLSLEVTAAISREAGDFAERYGLRGFDALHLASFAEVARRAGPEGTWFSSFDERLNDASRSVAQRLARGE